MTRRLLEHWHDKTAREYPFYFCQLEAIETLIWWVEGASEFKQGIVVAGDGGPWERLCNKMATGAGKTTVMAMIITWQALNALTYPKRSKDFSRAVFDCVIQSKIRNDPVEQRCVCARLASRRKRRRRKIEATLDAPGLVQTIEPFDPSRRLIEINALICRGLLTDLQFGRLAIGMMRLVVDDDDIAMLRQLPEDTARERFVGLGALLDDRTLRLRCWHQCVPILNQDFGLVELLAKGFGRAEIELIVVAPLGRDQNLKPSLYGQARRNDESGLVKTPRVVVRDDALPDARTLRPKLYHIYRDPSVSEDLNRKAERLRRTAFDLRTCRRW